MITLSIDGVAVLSVVDDRRDLLAIVMAATKDLGSRRRVDVGEVRFGCYICGKSVSSALPRDVVLRAVAVCPECIEAGRTPDRDLLDDVARVLRAIGGGYVPLDHARTMARDALKKVDARILAPAPPPHTCVVCGHVDKTFPEVTT